MDFIILGCRANRVCRSDAASLIMVQSTFDVEYCYEIADFYTFMGYLNL